MFSKSLSIFREFIPSSVILYLIFAIFWGKIIFDTLPDLLGFFGIFLILISGILVTIQANRLKNEVV